MHPILPLSCVGLLMETGEARDQQPPSVPFCRSAEKLLIAENTGWLFVPFDELLLAVISFSLTR